MSFRGRVEKPWHRGRRICFALLAGAVCGVALAPCTRGDEYTAAREPIDRRFALQLEQLAGTCEEVGLAEQARISRHWRIARDPRRQYLFLPSDARVPQPPATAPQLVQFWHRRFAQDRARQAEELFALAQRLAAGDATRCYQLLHEVLRENPDHREARRILGYREVGGKWQKEAARPKSRPGRFRHPKYGWQKGQFWLVDSEHYRIATDHSARAGIDLAQQLEQLHDVWEQLFYSFWSVEGALAERFRGHDTPLGKSRQHQVVLFRNRTEYVAQLSAAQPQIAISVGYYADAELTAYFYVGADADRPNWYHEATHQLFQESGPAAPRVAADANAWIIEGIALYMESLSLHDSYATVGGCDAERLQYARYRALNEGFYVPVHELLGLGREALQRHEHIARLYSQSAGLAHFFMDGRQVPLRKPLIEYLRKVYAGNDSRNTLLELVRTDAARVDRLYHEFLGVSDEDLKRVPHPELLRNLCLGHTAVTDDGLGVMQGSDRLEWLDLAFTQISDAGIEKIAVARDLKQLNLEHTRITDRALRTVRQLQQLEELDLSGTAVTDEGLKQISQLRNLKVLWLTGTRVSNAGLSQLETLKNLETLDLDRTAVTDAGWQTLKRKLPALKER